jgi:hypothetical protein
MLCSSVMSWGEDILVKHAQSQLHNACTHIHVRHSVVQRLLWNIFSQEYGYPS